MAVNESVRAAGIDLAHIVREIAKDEVSAELQRCPGGLTEKERRILDMWPRFEDGELVMPGDKVHYASAHNDETEIEVESITAMDGYFVLCDDECRSNQYEQGQRVKRPAPKVLDADGVEIKMGDTVWIMPECTETPDEPYGVKGINKYGEVLLDFHFERSTGMKGEYLTHTPPDSWGRLEEDVESIRQDIACNFGDFSPSNFKQSGDSLQDRLSDIVRRAKALAKVEVAE